MITVLCYEKCSTCQKAIKWLDENNVKYQKRPIKEENPSLNEIKKWHKESKLDIKRFYNTSGKAYKELGLSTKLKDMSLDEQYKLLSSDGMLVKRPLLISDKGITTGFKLDEWQKLI